ncbi:apolipoprotein N-acyltransferase [Novosphingobium mangrovi (ex Huang et al. 2023)]|uniref:Apolipoprotein N-acyltransferase n=1 Tax=Novosphingobium mangrovi (ex Huang et al. 2023) TaxID=2976432 RepID=A0ABT2I2S4_9SPHN|nr:apolipoprotein N-acyltransferase [Novosphingobium mangrovi (ex Huang et al. 2023)]MCT2399110.1 apolipoprotein N-acyltransferase [Novosphingobium mangrovi (ex Huang et al. 2023)]
MHSPRRALPFPKIPPPLARFPRLTTAGFAIMAGAIAACGFQPLSLWPLTLLGIALLLEIVSRTGTARGALMIGWCFGLGHFTLGDNWIATAFTYQANMPAWLGGIAVVLLSFYLAIYPALATLAAWLVIRPDRARAAGRSGTGTFLALVLAFASAWIVTEWMRAWVFTGFAWNPIGIALLGQFQTRGLALVTPWIGTYGLSGLLVLLAGLPGLFLRAGMHATTAPRRWIWALPALAIAAALSALMIEPDPWVRREEGAVRFTLVQPDLRQEIVDDPRYYEANFLKLARLSLPRTPGEKRVVFWPESGLGDYLRDGYPPYLYRLYTFGADPMIARERIGSVIGPYGLLLTGAVDLVMKDDEGIAARNSVTAIDGKGDIVAGYSKAHLVPFGEYLPLRWLLEPLGASRFVAGALDFWPGPGPRTYDLGAWGEAGIQICYEIVFSGEVVDPLNRPDYIYNPSNDGWFGAWGPPQHLAQARLRAIEEGLPVLRSTTNGISAVIDADGIVRAAVPRHVAQRIDGRIPPPHEPTPFARYGNALPLIFAALLGLAALSMVALRRPRR